MKPVQSPFRKVALLFAALLVAPAAWAGVTPGFVVVEVGVPNGPQRLAAADVDGDGDLDLVVLSAGRRDSSLAVLLNGGGGSFSNGWSTVLPKAARRSQADLDLADLDLDGDPDLVIHLLLAADQVRLNAGDGRFDKVVPLPATGQRVQNLLGLLDGDQVPDLATYDLDPTGFVGGRQGVGDGSFVAGPVTAVDHDDPNARAELADVSGDGLPDVVRASKFGLEYLEGRAGAGFPGWGPSTVVWIDACADLELAHLDGDAWLDAVVTLPTANAIEVFHGLPGGGLSGPSPFYGGSQPRALAVADVNGDGLPDVIVGNDVGGTISILPGGAGGIYIDPPTVLKGARRLTDLVAADLDGDGDADLAATSRPGRVLLLLNTLVP